MNGTPPDVRSTLGHLDDVGTLDLRRDARLLEEALDEPGPPREVRVEHLDGDARTEELVARLVDRPHPAVADEAEEAGTSRG